MLIVILYVPDSPTVAKLVTPKPTEENAAALSRNRRGPSPESFWAKKSSPCDTSSADGLLDAVPEARSATMCVPVEVPSVIHNSRPCTPSSAVKNNRPFPVDQRRWLTGF